MVEATDTIKLVKEKLHEKRIHFETTGLRLIFTRKQLEDSQTIQDYGIKVIPSRDGAAGLCDDSDWLNLKEKLHEKDGSVVNLTTLIFAGKGLEDSKTIEHYGVKHGNTIHVIVVRTLPGFTFNVDTQQSDTIRNLKEHIYAAQKIPPEEQKLQFLKVNLKDSHTVGSYGIKEGSEILLILKMKGCIVL
ncbi:hypothetical protein CAPTEDRAFT_1967 [Capitella teleta]|uniref:Ubiquitin-like domain-containing protein n=1 Tax=Capitella teleta TaxID=283909 RepID=R7VAJ1_CAPTE|nr:hypothetical protein CAPTEDRAFT_1967 [Capitella teleta]|eukprot:ELU15557.1 hypothetical protein CAPTEDRAFT_1967 [Capitella teleta]